MFQNEAFHHFFGKGNFRTNSLEKGTESLDKIGNFYPKTSFKGVNNFQTRNVKKAERNKDSVTTQPENSITMYLL
jgi:hypothetical protein